MTDYPPTGFYFSVRMGTGSAATDDTNFREATGMTMDMGSEEYHEGGQNAFVHRLPTGSKGGTLVLKRGLILLEQPLYQWCEQTLQGGLATSISPATLSLQLLAPGTDSSPSPSVLKAWSIVRAWPTKWEVSGFNAQNGQLVVESLEFSYNQALRQS